jgi:hypothetical protein
LHLFVFVIQEDDFVQLAAMYYYVTFGSTNSVESAKKVVGECITTELIETKSQGKWIQLVTAAHTQVLLLTGAISNDQTTCSILSSKIPAIQCAIPIK